MLRSVRRRTCTNETVALPFAVAARSGPAPVKLANLGRVIRWVRDQDPRSSSDASAPPGGAVDPEVLAACDGFDEAWAETLADVQVFGLLPAVDCCGDAATARHSCCGATLLTCAQYVRHNSESRRSVTGHL